MFVAGMLSGLLGIGSGAFKVWPWTRRCAPLQGVDDDQQLHDRRDRRGQRRRLSQPRLHRSRTGHAGDARRAAGLGSVAGVDRCATACLRLVFALVILAVAAEMIYKGVREGCKMSHDNHDVKGGKMEQLLGNLLRIGVLLSAVVVLSGSIAYLISSGRGLPADHRVFRGEPGELRGPAGIVADALTGESRGVIQFGLLLLVATPVARVAFSVIAFVRELTSSMWSSP